MSQMSELERLSKASIALLYEICGRMFVDAFVSIVVHHKAQFQISHDAILLWSCHQTALTREKELN